LFYATPLALAATGEVVVQRSGVINIGLEGAMLAGAFFGMLATHATGSLAVGVAAGVFAGVMVALLFAIFTVHLGRDQVVVGTAINLLVLGLTSTLYRSEFGQTGQPISLNPLPKVGGVDLGMAALLVLVPVVAYLLRHTGWGLAVKAAGEYPKAAEAAGFSVSRLRTGALLIGGFFAGLAGVHLALGVVGSFAVGITAGRGFVAIAIVTFGRWKPGWVLAAALLIGYLDGLQYGFQSQGWKVPFQLFIALPYIVALVVLVVLGKGTLAPGALGRPYRKDR